MSSSLTQLLEFIKLEAEKVSHKEIDTRQDLTVIFQDSISQTMQEIKLGANSSEFPDFVMINFIIAAFKEGFNANEIKDFIDHTLELNYDDYEGEPSADPDKTELDTEDPDLVLLDEPGEPF